MLEGKPYHVTVKVRDQKMNRPKNEAYKRVVAWCQDKTWKVHLHVRNVTGEQEKGSFQCILREGGPLTDIENDLKLLRGPHHGTGHFTISM